MTFMEANTALGNSSAPDEIKEEMKAFGIKEFKNLCATCLHVDECNAIQHCFSVADCNFFNENSIAVSEFRLYATWLVDWLKERLEPGEFDSETTEELVEGLVDEFFGSSEGAI